MSNNKYPLKRQEEGNVKVTITFDYSSFPGEIKKKKNLKYAEYQTSED